MRKYPPDLALGQGVGVADEAVQILGLWRPGAVLAAPWRHGVRQRFLG
jgi:hypothetical protein